MEELLLTLLLMCLLAAGVTLAVVWRVMRWVRRSPQLRRRVRSVQALTTPPGARRQVACLRRDLQVATQAGHLPPGPGRGGQRLHAPHPPPQLRAAPHPPHDPPDHGQRHAGGQQAHQQQGQQQLLHGAVLHSPLGVTGPGPDPP